jgi:glycosyltransferase involved in cell wall biosynthesis
VPIAVGALKNPAAVFLAKCLERLAYANSTRVVVLSPGMKDGVLKTGFPENKMTVIPNSCDFHLFDVSPELGKSLRTKYTWLANRPLVLYAGSMGKLNGVDYLAKLCALTSALVPNIVFVVIGDGKDRNKVLQTAEHLGVLNKTFFMLDPVSKSKMPAWLSAADLASSLVINIQELWANSANKFFDALAAGVPVAVNYGGWQADLIHKYQCGVIFDPVNIRASAERLTNIIRDRAFLVRAGITARNIGKEMFCRDRLAKKLEQVLLDAFEDYRTDSRIRRLQPGINFN